jgi:hypothetical protein
LAFLGPKIAFSGDIVVSNFGAGLDTLDNPAEIPPNAAQDLLNVNLQPGGAAVFKRDGFGLFQSLPIACSTCAVHGGYHFQQVGGNDVQLWGNDTELAGSVNDAAFVKLATGTVGATWQCADSQGFAYCLDSSRDTAVKTDGSAANTSFQSGIPLGTMLTFTPLQLVVAGVSGNESTIYVSQTVPAFTTFTVGVLPSSAFTEPIASPGSRITHLAYYFGKLFWWKDQSFGYATFTNQFDWQLTIVSNQIGTLDNSDAFWNSSGFDSGAKFTGTAQANAGQSPGGIFFRGQDNHFYVYDGYYLTRISRPITPTVTTSSRRKANAWTQMTSADFNSGSFTTTTYNSGFSGVIESTNDVNPPDNSLENQSWTNNAWTFATSQNSIGQCHVASAKDGTIFAYEASLGVSVVTVGVVDSVNNTIYASTGIALVNTNCNWVQHTIPASPNNVRANVNLRVFINGTPNNLFDLYSSTFNYNGNAITFWNATDGVFKIFYVDFFQGGQTTLTGSGIYYSAVNNAPNLTSWDTFSAVTQTNGGTHSFFTRASTNSFTVTSSTPAWVAQTLNATITASTGTYFQMSDTFTITASSQNPILQNFKFNWFEGNASDKAYMTYFNDAIWFSVSASSNVSTNNRIFYWDLLNGAWLIYDIPSNGFQIENNALYFGSPTNGSIFKYGGVTTDNAAAINSYWRSKSFFAPSTLNPYQPPSFEDTMVQKEFIQADFVLGESSTTLTYTYTLDSSTSTVFNMTAFDSKASLIQRNFLLPPGKIGKYYDFKIGDNSSAAPWRFMGHRVKYNPLNWRPVLN